MKLRDPSLAVFVVPFAPRFLQHPGPGGVRHSALTSDYRIFVTRNDGAEVLMVIERPLPAESFGTDEWRAANDEGKLLGSVPAPTQRENRVPAFGPDYLLTIRRDSLDLDHVDVWRFERGS